jgi:uncharacterized circularly permuted ATP-grasp superfamily protein
MSAGLFSGYDPAEFFDEVFTPDGGVRPHYDALIRRLGGFGADELSRREKLRDAAFHAQGITFTVYGEGDGIERTFPMDLIPRVIPSDEWAEVEKGLVQRVTALNRFLDDLYVGEQGIVRDGIIPRWLVLSSDGFERNAHGLAVTQGARCVVAGIDLVRDVKGEYVVLEDNLRNPSGISYVLENRAAMARVLPSAFQDHSVRSVDHYGFMLHDALQNAAPPAAGDEPTVVVLTPGVYNSAYFEHAFLARRMGVELVEGRDLVVDDHVVSMRTTHGLRRVDVIYRRIDDRFLDPVVFHPDSQLGVPGLMAAARAGNVTISNAVGNGVADDKAVYAFVPEMISYYMNEEPILSNVTTYLLWEDDQRAEVLERLDQLVVKPVAESGGYGMLIGPASTDAEVELFRKKITADPRGYIAQEVVSLSRHPTLVDDHVEGRHIDLRPFVISGEKVEVVPGGLTRVALRRGSLVVNSSQGGGSKDTWILAPDSGLDEVGHSEAEQRDDLDAADARHTPDPREAPEPREAATP